MTLAAHVRSAGVAARAGAPSLARASDEVAAAVIAAMATHLQAAGDQVLAANRADVAAAQAAGMSPAMCDRLLIDAARLDGMGAQLRELAAVPAAAAREFVRTLPTGATVWQQRIPVGVIGANFEARPAVTVDVASQLIRSRNGGVLRTGAAALGTSMVLIDQVVAPALAAHDIDPGVIQLIRTPAREAAFELVSHPDLIPLVILRGSGDSTRALTERAAGCGVRTLAHADGGAVLVIAPDASPQLVATLLRAGLDRFGVCNRVNLVLIAGDQPTRAQEVAAVAHELDVTISAPPHSHPIGQEWALQEGHERTITLAFADSVTAAAHIASQSTPGIAATIATEAEPVAAKFMAAYTGTGVFWNESTRLLDGYKLLGVPETGINVDRLPGPRGPVTFRDLTLRQFVVLPARAQ